MASSGPAVLVAEDEPLIRIDMVYCLTDFGFEVIEATSADQAIKILESRDDLRLLFTDVDMPGSMDGLKLAAFVRDRWPPIKLIIASGHVAVRVRSPCWKSLFKKPYERKEIAGAVRDMIQH